MMKRIFISLIFISFVFFAIEGCNKDSDSITNDSKTGTLQISMTDASADFDSVKIAFSNTSAHINSEWITVQHDPMIIDLLEWNNGESIIIGTEEVPAGHYTQVRLIIDSAFVFIGGQKHQLDVPSGAQTGLKLGPEFDVLPGSTYELVIDFDADRSIVVMGPPMNPIGYKLKPHMRMVPRAITGSISGTVTNPEHLPVAFALMNGDTVTTSRVEETTGFFKLAFLKEGQYDVVVSDTLDQSFEQDDVPVTVGTDYDLGMVTLQ